MKFALIALTVMALYQPSFGEAVALSIHMGKIEGPGFSERDVAIVLEAESIVGPSVIAVEGMIAGDPITGAPEQITHRSITMGSRLIVGPHVCRLSAGGGVGVAEKKFTTVSDRGFHEKTRQKGIQVMGVLELRIATKKGTCVSARAVQLRTRFPTGGERLIPVLKWKPARLYTLGVVAEFG